MTMGWSSANGIFDPIAHAFVDLNAPDDMKTQILSRLIGVLQEGDWDTEVESLGEFQDDPAIVEAFRQNDVLLTCGTEGERGWCELERGHEGNHRDGGYEWPNTTGVGAVSPTTSDELGEWLRALPDGTILRGAKGLGWQLGYVTVIRLLLDPLKYRALTTLSGESFEVSDGCSDLDRLVVAGPFTVLALGEPQTDES